MLQAYGSALAQDGCEKVGGNESSVHRVMVNGQLGVLFDTEVPSPQFHYQSNTVSPCAPVAKHWGSLSLGLFGKSSQRWSDGRSTPCWHWPGGEAAKVGAFEWAKGPQICTWISCASHTFWILLYSMEFHANICPLDYLAHCRYNSCLRSDAIHLWDLIRICPWL